MWYSWRLASKWLLGCDGIKLCARIIILCARIIISCARIIISCAQIIILCARIIILCARIMISCARIIILCARIIILCAQIIFKITMSPPGLRTVEKSLPTTIFTLTSLAWRLKRHPTTSGTNLISRWRIAHFLFHNEIVYLGIVTVYIRNIYWLSP